MKKLKFIKYLFIVFVISGCATSFMEIKEEDLVQKFNLDNVELQKYQSVKSIIPKIEDQKQVKSKDINITEKKSVLTTLSTTSTSSALMIVDDLTYPKDYPEQLIKYDKQFKKTWNLFRPILFPGEEFTFVVRYLGITAGYLKMRTLPPVMVAGKKSWHIRGRLKSAEYYKYIYELDDSVESFISQKDFLPLKFQLIQRESMQEVDDLQLFDSKKRKTFFWYRRLKRGQLRKHEKSGYIPKYIQDSFSALYFARGLPLKKGVVYEYPVVTRAKIWIVKFEVVAKEKIEFKDKEIDALKIKAETRFPGVLKKRGDIVFWMSDDDRRLLLKFEAKVKIGSISGKLLDYIKDYRKGKTTAFTDSVKE